MRFFSFWRNTTLFPDYRSVVQQARGYYNDDHFRFTCDSGNYHAEHIARGRQILGDLDEEGWRDFCLELVWLGDLKGHNHLNSMLSNWPKLVRTVGYLMETSIPVSKKIDRTLSRYGDLRVKGLGIHQVTKVLACTEPEKWPIVNSTVHEGLKRLHHKLADEEFSCGQNYSSLTDDLCRLRDDSKADSLLWVKSFLWDYGKPPKVD